ncbi:hypothetical protein AURDEDRAFT_56960 [Auricularia subglabra TFB-10046 SS5]|nr:hypothetical protein AURDEDRAFT_56960 [Auricularia subglabra TFB-10046 SS5]
MKCAEAHRDCLTAKGRADIKRSNGIAWSQLLRLPYWDPTRFTVVDAMHNLLLGLIQYHIRRVWKVEMATKQTKPKKQLTQIREIIARISTPSWLGRVATDFGSPSHGAPKADEWRTAGTVHLPMALCVMWAGTDRQADLDWFLELATAVQLAIRRSTSKTRADDYRLYLRKYLHGLVDRGFTLRPNHHAALHLGDFLPEFGPTRSWWAYPIERQVGLLQKINTNDRFGEDRLLYRSHFGPDAVSKGRWKEQSSLVIIALRDSDP